MVDRKSSALVLEGARAFVEREFDVPDPTEDSALVEIELGGICGTDVKVYRQEIPAYPSPLIMGHEILARVVAMGPAFEDKYQLSVGDRVTINSIVPCLNCSQCAVGKHRFCPRRRQYGLSFSSDEAPHLLGAFSRFMYVKPGSMLRRIPEDVPAEAAILIEGVVANGMQWARTKAGIEPPDVVVVQGCGPQGLGCVAVAKECGASMVIVTGMSRDSERLEMAKLFGADHTLVADDVDVVSAVADLTNGEMADKVIDVTGSPHAWTTTIGVAGIRSTVVVAGLAGANKSIDFSSDELVFKEITVKGALAKGQRAVMDAAELVISGRYPFERMVTHVFDVSDTEKAIQAVAGELDGEYPVKAAIKP